MQYCALPYNWRNVPSYTSNCNLPDNRGGIIFQHKSTQFCLDRTTDDLGFFPGSLHGSAVPVTGLHDAAMMAQAAEWPL
jgi:hypothetical protein